MRKTIEDQTRTAMVQDSNEMHRRDLQKGHAIVHLQETYFKGPCEFDLEKHKEKGMQPGECNAVSKRYDPWAKAFTKYDCVSA